jgi:glycosyltransferase involved in cell wall biosynthesis
VVYNGIQPVSANHETVAGLRSDFGLEEDDVVLGTVARLDPVKNQAMMLNAVARVADLHPQVRLVIVGDGPERSKLEDQAYKLGIAEKVIFTGFMSHPSDYLGLMDVFLLSSDTEGTSMTLLEAMCMGVPIVATNAGGTPEIVLNELTGLVTPVGDTREFSNAIIRLMADPDHAAKLGQAGKHRFTERYSICSMAGVYLDLYKQEATGKVEDGAGHV